MTQKELAKELQVKPQQIQRYEATRYASASLTRLLQVADALGIEMHEDVTVPSTEAVKVVWRRLSDVGIDREFVLSRLLPPGDAPIANKLSSGALLNMVKWLERVFGLGTSSLFGPGPVRLPGLALASARFKTSKVVDRRRLASYSVYAHCIAALVAETVPHLPVVIPHRLNPDEIHISVLGGRGYPTFDAALRFVWSLGIPVIPLSDSGTFHGACWRIGSRPVVVLKQRSQHESRWLFDLLHELYHTIEHLKTDDSMWLETDEIGRRESNETEELEANDFADEVVFDGVAEELAELAVGMANGKVQLLKAAVTTVAEAESVDVGALANYVAHRVSHGNVNWWGVANNLQRATEERTPFAIARDFLLANMDIGRLGTEDQGLVVRALQETREVKDGSR